MPTFAMKGNTEEKIHGSHSRIALEITGFWYATGHQPVSALPEWVAELFNSDPEITQVAVNYGDSGVLYTRSPEHRNDSEPQSAGGAIAGRPPMAAEAATDA